jgi:hypothetical protein
MRIKLRRRYLGPAYTIGSWYDDGVYLCDTIEDKVRDTNKDGDLDDPGEKKVFGETAIPYGKYKIDLTMSPKFKRLLPIILDVRHFTGIRVHRGKTAKHSHGCILPGENKAKGEVWYAQKYEMLIVEALLKAIRNGEKSTIEIV